MSVPGSPMNGAQAMPADSDFGKVGKRNRAPKSCEPCRIRKLKCNREKPCDSCIKRGKEAVCEYAPNADRSKTDHNARKVKPSDRLQRLEDLVLQFMENGVSQSPDSSNGTGKGSTRSDSSLNPQSAKSTDRVPHGPPRLPSESLRAEANFNDTNGLLDVNGSETNYVDSSHWLSVLNEIKEVREYLQPGNSIARESLPENGPGTETSVDLVFGLVPQLQLPDILRGLPQRHIVDSLLSCYFNTNYMILPIIHPTKFQREYETFWKDQTKAPVMWVGLLFAILTLAATLRHTTDALQELGGSLAATRIFRTKTAQCLVLGKYASPKAYGVETLLLHLQSNYMASEDCNVNTWVLMGILVRLAMKMGAHRDPKHYPNISPFDGEMRRRLWQILFQLDVLVSFQMGLPSMIQASDCDTEPPRNLHYSDFDEETAELPPTRPLTDSTPATYIVFKCACMAVFKKIAAQTSSLRPAPYQDVLDLDKEMRDCYNEVSTDLKMKAMAHSFTDAPSTIMNRLNIKLLYLKGICVLHRKYLNQDRLNPRYAYSRRVCVEAAMETLELQADVHNSSLPGGQLYEDRWMLSSLTAHDFLLAAMIVCLDLSESLKVTTSDQLSVGPLSLVEKHSINAKQDSLERSQRIWSQSILKSKDAHTAADALALMLRKVKINMDDTSSRRAPPPQLHHVSQPSPVSNGNEFTSIMDGVAEIETDLPYAAPMQEMIDVPENIDWAQLDQYFLNPALFEPLAETFDFPTSQA